MTAEIWKDIPNCDGKYQVSNWGRVRSFKRKNEKILKQNTLKNGYKQIELCFNGKRKNVFVHRLVADAFIPNTDNKPCVNHKNKATNDNRVENLEWCTAGENNRHARYYYLPLIEIKNIARMCLERGSGYDWVKALEEIEKICVRETQSYTQCKR